MKRSEAILRISEKLQKQIHLINSQTQRDNPKMLCDNLALIVMTEIENIKMLPPMIGAYDKITTQLYGRNEWEPEDE